ncbi:MAG: hypothetical protein WCH65_04255 [bacterium]
METKKTKTLIFGISSEMLLEILAWQGIQNIQEKHELIFAPTLDDAIIAIADATKAGSPFQKMIYQEGGACIEELQICIKQYFADAQFETVDFYNVTSYSAMKEHWYVAPEYAGYEPIDQKWKEIEMLFHTNKYGPKNPLFLNLVKGDIVIGVSVYGFEESISPNEGNKFVALCKVLAKKRCIAIEW